MDSPAQEAQLEGLDGFLSYSHIDRNSVRLVQEFIEDYRLPAEPGAQRRTLRIFRDDTDIRTGSLPQELSEALTRSRYLIVCVSPSALASPWVRQELAAFATRPHAILAVLLQGQAQDVRQLLGVESRYADLRGLAKSRRIGRTEQVELVRVIAQLAQTDVRVLVPWHEERRRRRRLAAMAASLGVLALLSTAAGAWYVQRELANTAKAQAATAEAQAATESAQAALQKARADHEAQEGQRQREIAELNAREAARNQADSYVQRGQRAALSGDRFQAQHWFAQAFEIVDTPLARAGLVDSVGLPLAFAAQWQSAAGAGVARAGITAMAFVDPRRVVAGDTAGRLTLVDLEGTRKGWTLDLGSAVNGLSYSSHSRRLSAGLKDGRLVDLDPESGRQLGSRTFDQAILSVRHSPDGSRLLIGLTQPGGVVVLDGKGDTVWALQHNHAGSVQGTAFTRQSDHVFWGGSSSYVWACKLPDQGCDRPARVESWVYAIDVSADNRFIGFGAGGKLQLVDQVMRQQSTIAELAGHLFAVSFDPSGQYLAVAGSDKTVSLYDVRSQKLVAKSAAHQGAVNALAFNAGGSLLVSGGADGRLVIWRVEPTGVAVPAHGFVPSPQMLAATQRNSISDIRVIDEQAAIVSTWDQRQRVLRLRRAPKGSRPLTEGQMSVRLIESLDLARTSTFKVQAFSHAKLWGQIDQDVSSQLSALESPDAKPLMALERSGKVLAAATPDGNLVLFKRGGKSVRLNLARKGASAVAVFGRVAYVGFEDGSIVGFDMETRLRRFMSRCGDSPVQFLVGKLRAQQVVSALRGGGVCVLDSSGKVVVEEPGLLADAIALSPDESMLAVGGLTGTVSLRDAGDLAELASYEGHRGAVHALHFTRDSQQLVSGGADEILRQWPAAEARRIQQASALQLKVWLASRKAMPAGPSAAPWAAGYSASIVGR